MNNSKISHKSSGIDLFQDAENYLEQLSDEAASLISGGGKFQIRPIKDICPTTIAQGTAITAPVVCITNPGGLKH